jgi:L-2-hydroxyglutarate oxidase LhgO
MLSLQADAQAHGALFAFNARIEGGEATSRGIELEVRDHATGESFRLTADSFVNATGLNASETANSIRGFPKANVPRSYLARGCYFALQGRSPFSRLIYPIPVEDGLGVHLTLDLAGGARFGPDVEWINEVDYRVDPRRADAFYSEIRQYWPGLADNSLAPAFAGIRPKIYAAGEPAADFQIDGPREHGVSGCVNLFGLESPGLTASLAIADLVKDKLHQ